MGLYLFDESNSLKLYRLIYTSTSYTHNQSNCIRMEECEENTIRQYEKEKFHAAITGTTRNICVYHTHKHIDAHTRSHHTSPNAIFQLHTTRNVTGAKEMHRYRWWNSEKRRTSQHKRKTEEKNTQHTTHITYLAHRRDWVLVLLAH